MSRYAIYQPKNKAAEYAQWACNFYVGCSNGCTYCYLKKGRGAAILGGDKPKLKACFKDETHALQVFEKELLENIEQLQKHGLFFSFTTDPMLPETIALTVKAIDVAIRHSISVDILTKKTEFTNIPNNTCSPDLLFFPFLVRENLKYKIGFGFSLTGHDEIETGSSTNAERIEAMKKLHNSGFRTFASIEPIIDFESSLRMIEQAAPSCDEFKIGLLSGQKVDAAFKKQLSSFVQKVMDLQGEHGFSIYWKDSISRHYKNSI